MVFKGGRKEGHQGETEIPTDGDSEPVARGRAMGAMTWLGVAAVAAVAVYLIYVACSRL
jgi:hypothetical protein